MRTLGMATLLTGVFLAVTACDKTSATAPGSAGPEPANGYYYDTVTKNVFTQKSSLFPPIQSPEGHEAVRVHYFTCGECTDKIEKDGGQRFVGYYEKYSAEVKELIEKTPNSSEFYEMAFKSRLYSADGEKWVAAESPDGFMLTEALQQKCPAGKLRYCPADR